MTNSLNTTPEEDPLYPYQIEGAKWLAERKLALLADEMGVGKTAQVIRACDDIGAERILILCPAVARINWQREFARFSKKQRKFSILMGKKDSYDVSNSTISSYDLAPDLHLKNLRSRFKPSWDVLILDEAHYLKNPNSKRTATVFGSTGLIRQSKRCWALSGTPAPNHPGELWALFYTFRVTPLKYDEFVERYCLGYQGPRGFTVTGADHKKIPELKTMLAKIMLRRKKENVLKDLPPIHFDHITVEAGPVDLDIDPWFVEYVFPQDRRHELTEKLGKERTMMSSILEATRHGANGLLALEAVGKSVSTLRRYTGLEKLQAVVDLVTEELLDGYYDKLVIFAVHQSVIEGLRQKLTKFKPVTLYGGTPPEKRQKNIDKFQRQKHCRLFIGNIQACGTAITLTAAHHVLVVESSWVPAENSQAVMRCHRIGQDRPVFVRFVNLANSIDEKINLILKRKTRDLTEIFDAPIQPHEVQN